MKKNNCRSLIYIVSILTILMIFIAFSSEWNFSKPKFIDAKGFSEGYAAVKIDEKYGYIDKAGKVVIKPQFDEAKLFKEGFAAIAIDDKYGLIDKKGNMILEPKFDESGSFTEGLVPVKLDDRWRYIDKTGKFVI